MILDSLRSKWYTLKLPTNIDAFAGTTIRAFFEDAKGAIIKLIAQVALRA